MDKPNKILIVGAGEGGRLLLKELKKTGPTKYTLVGFVDDNKIGKIENIPILGKIYSIPLIVKQYQIDEIIISIPSLKKEKLAEIISICKSSNAEVKILPSTYESVYSLKTGRPWYNPIRKINLEDLIKRKPCVIDFKKIKGHFKGKRILITGGGGSIGSELSRQISEFNPRLLVIVDNSEYNAYKIDMELRKKYGKKLNLITKTCDIKDYLAIEEICKNQKIDIVFHAAAYKHVPLMEFNIKEAVKNNIFGTYNVALAAEKTNVKEFILISTDKAVNPTSIMGVTKRITEEIIQLFDKTKFVTVRFGNVLGSKGSVIPLFEKQIKEGGPITLTHPKMTRYFMTIPEAAQLVIQAGIVGQNKEILILDMGKPYKIKEVAEELIRLSGLIPYKDIKIKYIGLRPGEKLCEELLTNNELLTKTQNERIFVSKAEAIDKNKLSEDLEELRNFLKTKEIETKRKLKKMLPSYKIKKPKIFITGSRGFIGSNLKGQLLNKGFEIIETPLEDNLEIDLSKKENFANIPPAEIVIHLASHLPQKGSTKEDYNRDIEMTRNIIEYCEKYNSKLIFISSSAVYGNTKLNPIKENEVINPINDYGKCKAECERLILSSKLKGVILRFFNIYGPEQHKKFLIYSINEDIKTGCIKIMKHIKRDMLYLSDATQSIINSIYFKNNHIKIFNIGSGKSFFIEEIADKISSIKKVNPIKEYLEPNETTILDICADISLAKKHLKWKPKISLDNGLKLTIENNKT